MTLPTSSRVSDVYTTNGTQKDFSFGFRVFYDPENGGYGLEVRRQTETGYEVIPKSQYDVIPSSDSSSGIIRFYTPPASGMDIYIAGNTATIQQLNLTNYGRYDAESIETQFDYITAIIQEWLSSLGEETRQRIASDEALNRYVVQRINDFVQQVNQNWDDKSQEIEDYIATIMPSFTQTLRDEIEAFAVAGMQDAIDQTLADSKAEIDDAVARANAAALAAAITGKVYDTPEAGVDPVTGVQNGAYYNVRSTDDDSYLVEYQNIGGIPTPSGKSYPSAAYVQYVAKHTALPFVAGKTYSLNERAQLANGDIVRNTIPNNTTNPNIDMTGWVEEILDKQLHLYVNNVDEIKSKTPKEFLHLTIKDKNSTYKWDSNSTLTPDDYFVIQSNRVSSGRWLLVNDRVVYADELIDLTDTSSQDVLNALNFNNRNLQFNYNYTISDTLRLASDNSSFIGGTTNTITYNGDSGSPGSLKAIIANRKTINGAIARQQIKNLTINMGQKDYCIGFDSYYLTSESLVERVSVNNIADNSVGFKISKCWYAKYRQCFVSGYNANIAGRHGTGVLIESLQTDGAQVNAVSVDFRCHTLDIGIHIKPIGYIYGLNMLDMPTIENCNIGIKYDPQTSTNDYQVRQSVISAYFENNGKDVVWGNPNANGSRSSKHTWLNCSFDDVYSTIELYEGHHVFIGCKGIKNLHVGAGAKVRLINSGRPTTISGVTSNIVIEQDPTAFVTAGSYQTIYTRPQGALKLKSTIASGDTTATFDLSQALNSTIVSEGQTGMLRIMSRRSYDTAPSILTAVILRKSSGATVTLTNTPPSSLSATLDAAGILTVTETRTDSRFIDVVFNPD